MVLVGACSASTTPAPAASATTPPASAAAPSTAASAAAPSAAASAAPAAAVPTVPTGYTELDKALGSSQPFKGKTVSIQVQWTQGELTNFQASLADFQKATGHHDPGRQRPDQPRDGAEEPDRGRRAA